MHPFVSVAALAVFSTVIGAASLFQTQLTLSSSGWPQGTAYDDRTDTLFIGTSVSNVPYTCRIIAAQGITPALAAGSPWSWMDTGVGSCSGRMGAPTGVAWAKGASFGRPDDAVNDVLFFSAYTGHSVWAYSPALKLTALVAGTGSSGATNGPGKSATFASPEGIAFIDNVNGVARTSVIVADYGNSCVREVRIDWPPTSAFGAWDVTVATIAGACGLSGNPPRFQQPRNVAFGSNTADGMYVGDDGYLRLVTGWSTGSPSMSTVTSAAGLSVSVLPATDTGTGVDYVLYGYSGGIAIRAQPTDGGAASTTTVDSPFSASSVRYVGWLPTGHVIVTSTTALAVSNSAILPRSKSGGNGSESTTDDASSDYTMLWILLGVGVPFALGVGVALGCCVDRCCCEDKAARALAHADTNSGEAAGVVVEMVPVQQSPPTALEVPPTAEPREIARTVPATPATVAGLQTDTRHSAVADQPAPAVGERMATDSEPAARAAFVANVPAATSDVDDLDDACDRDRRAVRGPPCDSFSSAGDAVDCAVADVDPCILVAEAAPATSSVVAQADEEDAQCGCDGSGPAPAIEEANPAATNVSVDDVASPPTSSAEAAEEGYHDDGGLEDFAVDLADVHLDG